MAYRTTSWKNTDIGKIPSDWDVKQFGNSCEINPPNKPLPDKFLYIDLESVVAGKLVKKSYVEAINAPSRAKRRVQYGDFLFQTVRPYQCNNFYFNMHIDNVVASTGYALIRSTGNDNKFIYYLVHMSGFVSEVLNLCTGTSYPSITPQKLACILISIPKNVKEQQKIAEVLTDLDDLIAELEKVRDKKQAIKIGAMQELLTGKRRLPGFNKPWKEVELGELLTYEQPQNYIVRSEEYRKTGTPVLTAGKTFVLGYTDEIDNIFSSVPVIIFDDFTTVSKFVNFPFKVKSSAIKILKLKNIEDNLKFIFEVMQITPFNLLNHQRYWISKYSKMSIKVPEYIEQTAIANVLSDMDNEISAINDKINKYKQIKAGVADELLSGRIRLIKPQE